MSNESQQPRLVVGNNGKFYVAQFITPEDVTNFKEVVRRDFPDDDRLLNTYDEEAQGSSVFGNIVMANVLLESGWDISDFTQIYDANRTFDNNCGGAGVSTRNCYSDCRIAIRKKTDVTEHILEQVENKDLTKECRGGVLKTPISVPFAGLNLRANGHMQNYFVQLTPQSKVVASPQYDPRTDENKRFSIFDADGNPILDTEGAYRIYNNDNAVVGVYAVGALGLGAGDGFLGCSDGCGRVVKYRAEGTAKIFADNLAKKINANFQGLDEVVRKKHAEELKRLEEFKSSFVQ